MADLSYQVSVDTKQAQASLAQLQQTVNKTQQTFGALKTAIAGLAFGAAIRGALQYADAISDIADATGMAVNEVVGFGKAVTAAGGNTEKAQAALTRFSLSLGEAAAGGAKVQDAFLQIGVSLDDLRTLSESDLFKKTIEGLGKVTDVSRRATLQNELFGKTLRGVDLAKVAALYGTATVNSARYVAQIQKAAEVQDKLDAALSQFKISLINALGPLTDLLANLKPEQIDRFVTAVVNIGVALGALAASVKVLQYISGALALIGTAGAAYILTVKGAFAGLATTVAAAAVRWNGFVTAFGAATTVFGKVAAIITTIGIALSKTIPYAIVNFLKFIPVVGTLVAQFEKAIVAVLAFTLRLAAVGAVIVGINELIKKAFDVDPIDSMAAKLEKLVTDKFPALAAVINKVGEKLGMAAPPSQRQSTQENTTRVQEENNKLQAAANEQAKEQERIQRQIEDAFKKQRQEIARISAEFKQQLDDKAEQLQLETSLVGKGEQQRDLAQALFDLNKKTTDEVDKLRKAQADLSEEARRRGLGEEYERQIRLVQELAAAEQSRLTALVEGLNRAKAAEQLRQFNLKQEYDAIDKLTAIGREYNDLVLTDQEKKLREIARAADDAATAAIREENARRGVNMSLEEELKYREAARKKVGELQKAQIELNRRSREFATGWTRAFKQFVDDAGNAARTAERLFEKFTSGLEDAIVNFVKTGKFQFKDFVASMAEELLRAQIKQLIANIMQVQNPFGGQGSTIGDLFGGIFGALAGGNQPGASPNNPLYAVVLNGGPGGGGNLGGILTPGGGIGGGKSGGGIFDMIGSGIGKVVDTIGSIFGGTASTYGTNVGSQQSRMLYEQEKDLGGGFFDSITSGIGNAIGSIGDFFGGFFANGGTIPAGKFGIVGERGPEFVSGPGTVTPMGGATQVTYNINAVDAASFKQLVAQDPSFIFAVTEQGRKSLPQGRR